MSQAEHPDRLRDGRRVTVDDVRQLMGASTPHFALQLRERIRALIRGLDADVVFYPESYANFGDGLAENFANGNYIGTPLLQTFGMAAARGENAYPRMLRWVHRMPGLGSRYARRAARHADLADETVR